MSWRTVTVPYRSRVNGPAHCRSHGAARRPGGPGRGTVRSDDHGPGGSECRRLDPTVRRPYRARTRESMIIGSTRRTVLGCGIA
eukprot:768288-Hanusia_phi.AAC.2